jgi:hypothetical protein
MQKLMYVLRLSLLTGLCLMAQHGLPGRAHAHGLPRAEVPQVAATSRSILPALRRRTTRLRRNANPAAGTGRDYFRPRRLPSQRKPDSFSVRARYWWASHRLL